MSPTINNYSDSKYYVLDKKNNVILKHDVKQNDKTSEPEVVICTEKDPKTGEIKEKTLPMSYVDKIYSAASNKVVKTMVPFLVWGGVCAADITARYNALDFSSIPADKEYRIKTMDDVYNVMELSDEVDEAVPSMDSHGKRFIFALAENKESLMKDLDLNDEQYDNLADIALKISKNESQFGSSLKYRAYMVAESYLAGAYGASKVREYKSADNDPTLSRGMTQYKIGFATDAEKELFDKYNITYDNLTTNIQYPEKSAVATLIHLGSIQKGYNHYLQKMNEIAPDMSDPEVQKSIENAKSIVFDDELRPKAIKALTQVNGSEEESEYLKNANLTKDDLEDLRTYAKGIQLSEKAFVAAGWPGKNIRPYGKSADLGCANLINAAAGVGYIANITDNIKLPE